MVPTMLLCEFNEDARSSFIVPVISLNHFQASSIWQRQLIHTDGHYQIMERLTDGQALFYGNISKIFRLRGTKQLSVNGTINLVTPQHLQSKPCLLLNAENVLSEPSKIMALRTYFQSRASMKRFFLFFFLSI